MTSVPVIFDRRALRRQRDRAANRFHDYDFLFAEVAERLADRLIPIRRRFPLVLDLGCHIGGNARYLTGKSGIETVVGCDASSGMAARAARAAGVAAGIAADEDCLPFAAASFDLVFSNLGLHWVNDLPGSLIQIRQILKPDGFFLAALLGRRSLIELRQSFLEAESELSGGVSPRVSPFPDVADMAGLLVRAGFVEPVADTETLTVSYPNLDRLMADLRGVGAANALAARRRQPTPRALFQRTAARYLERFAEAPLATPSTSAGRAAAQAPSVSDYVPPAADPPPVPPSDFGGDTNRRLPATLEILYLAGWGPGAGR